MHIAFIMKVEPHKLKNSIRVSIIFGVPELRWTKRQRANKKLFIFTPFLEKEGKYISSNDWLPGSFSYWYGNPVSCCEATMYSSSENLLRSEHFGYRIQVRPLLVASVIFLFDIMITPHAIFFILSLPLPPPPPQKKKW